MAAEKEKESEIGEFNFFKPNDKTSWEKFRQSLYDPETKTVFGRTSRGWGILFVFYVCFYSALSLFFAVCLQATFLTLDNRVPKWQQDNGLIGSNPGVSVKPVSDNVEEGALILFNGRNQTSMDRWIESLNKFLEPYKQDQKGKNFKICGFNTPIGANEVCKVDLNDFGPCSPNNSYGYKGPSPCVFIKVNRIFGWKPDCYTDPIPEMPLEITYKITSLPTRNKTQIWVSCQGEHSVDRENIEGFRYYPSRGLPSYYYPYTNVQNYLSPLVAVQIVHPKPNMVLSIECRAWAKNIHYHGGSLNREGSIQFYLMRDYLNV